MDACSASKPCNIRFTQGFINSGFGDGRHLDATACQLAHGSIDEADTLDNRRLAVFRLLQLVGRDAPVKVILVPKRLSEWNRKFDTLTFGVSVTVRSLGVVIGNSLITTT